MNKKITLIFVSIILVLSMGAVKGAEGIDITSSDKRVIIGDSREIPVTLKNNANDEYARVDMVIWKLMDEVNGSETLIGKGTIKGNKTINGIRLDMEDNQYDNMDIDDEKTKQLRVTANETAVAGEYSLEFVVYGMKKGKIDYHYPSMGLEISDDPFDLRNGEIRIVGRGGKEAYPGDTISADLKITNHYSETSEIDVKLGFYGKETKISVSMGRGEILEKNKKVKGFEGAFVSTGNPHFVIFSENASRELAKKEGPTLEKAEE